ncbi:MAG: choice-of-anchor tandem repeat GloVer-containing protein [Terriglobales bacterium]
MRVIKRIVILLLLPAAAFGAGPRLQVLHNFTGGGDGSSPSTALVADSSGNLYGTTGEGGSTNGCFGGIGCGVVFELSPPKRIGGSWKETILYRFTGGSDGAGPHSSLVFDTAGNLYGTTTLGGDLGNQLCAGFYNSGCGVVFELSPQGDGWSETTLYTFEGAGDGAFPLGSLVFDLSGNLYGTASLGGGGGECITGELLGCGTIFELSPNGSGVWTEATIYQFQGLPDGAIPKAGMVLDRRGNLYGTTVAGGAQGYGTVFELSPPLQQGGTWDEGAIYSFPASTPEPPGVMLDSQGNLYGTSDSGSGSVFELTPSAGAWIENTIYSFKGQKNAGPTALVMDKSGNLYGALGGPQCGALYRLENENDLWSEEQLDFVKGNEGPCGPGGALIFGKSEALYGTSVRGGTCSGYGCGTVFGILP